jgi:hypothetical protein
MAMAIVRVRVTSSCLVMVMVSAKQLHQQVKEKASCPQLQVMVRDCQRLVLAVA